MFTRKLKKGFTSALGSQKPLYKKKKGKKKTREVHTKFAAETDFRAVIHKWGEKVFCFFFPLSLKEHDEDLKTGTDLQCLPGL